MLGRYAKNMSLYKVCKSIDLSSQEWLDYCQWRQIDFTSFDSLDSSINDCETDTDEEEFWSYCVSTEKYLTDVVTDLGYAQRYARRSNSDIILAFDYIENSDSSRDILGYDILDGALDYSLLTNFSHDISIVNENIGINGLIKNKENILETHRWFIQNMKADSHVLGSRICTVYNKISVEVTTDSHIQ